jgi:GTP-binding protein
MAELQKFSPALARKECWLVFNKIDLLTDEQLQELEERVRRQLDWSQPILAISAVDGQGVDELCEALMQAIENHRQQMKEDQDYAEAQAALEDEMELEVRETIRKSRPQRNRRDEFEEFDDLEF